ncbi:unnamed protein product [Vicia faba]|uniref:Uncharacterized protein n=1 Tax=Vicia faba TaxID=3906 RepID=A0AAV0ZJ92_VICFA|nr:unnamed protein product [Vicia faba]
MARANCTLPICFFKIILQTNLQTIKIPNKFTRSHGVGLPNPMFIKPPDGTKWKVFWKNINEGTSELDVVILGQNALEIDYDDSLCDILDESDNVDDSDNESDEIMNEWLNGKKARQKSPLVSPKAHKKVRGEIEKNSEKATSLNRPKESRAWEVAEEFISTNPFFTFLIKPANLVAKGLSGVNLKEIIENKEKYAMLQIDLDFGVHVF